MSLFLLVLPLVVVLDALIQGAAAWSSITTLSPPLSRHNYHLIAKVASPSLTHTRIGNNNRYYNYHHHHREPITRLKLAAAASSGGGAVVPRLDKWKVLTNGRLVGTVSNHPTIDDGDLITTSRLKAPEKAYMNAVVVTETGSKYRLGKPMKETPAPAQQQKPAPATPFTTAKRNGVTAPPSVVAKQPPAIKNDSIPTLQEIQRIKKQYELTGEKIGDVASNNVYLLSGKLRRSTSGKSEIWTGYRADPNNGLPIGEAVTVKISKNTQALEREAENYRKSSSGLIRGNFVNFYDYFPMAAMSGKYMTYTALVIERGGQDLKAYLNENGALEGRDLRQAAATAVQCLQGLHSAGLVWTDLKTENFVVCANGDIKGIDLESAMPHRGNPVDYSPEACPPEFAEAFLDGEGPWFELEWSYDIWSFGMYLYEIAAGNGHFDGKAPALITKKLKNRDDIPMPEVKDDKLRDLIKQCLQFQPKDRPTLARILLHPYFLSTGIGRFSF